jgi:cytochrome bd-type quinol oxidase subunit 1
MWGFLAIQISGVMSVLALRDPDGRAAAVFLDDLGSQPLLGVLFGLPFMVGCVLGMLMLTIGMLLKGGVPRWIPGAWLVFILLDFSIGAVGPVDPHWLYLAGAVGLAAHLVRRGTAARAGA